MVIKNAINYVESFFLLKSVEKISKLNLHSIETNRLTLHPKVFLTPGRYSIVHRNKFNQVIITRFKIESVCHLTIKDIFQLSNIL